MHVHCNFRSLIAENINFYMLSFILFAIMVLFLKLFQHLVLLLTENNSNLDQKYFKVNFFKEIISQIKNFPRKK
jgi:hypothetical protein